MRRLELQAGAPRWQGGRGVWSTNEAMRQAERELALQAQRAYERTVKDCQQQSGRERDTGPRISMAPQASKSARQTPRPQVCALTRRRPRPRELSHDEAASINPT